MTFNLTQKLVMAFLVLTVLLLLATLGLARWSFERGFMDYVNTLEVVRLERLAKRVASEYQQQSGWQTVTPQRFDRWVAEDFYGEQQRVARPISGPPTGGPPLDRARPDGPPPGGPPSGGRNMGRPPPPREHRGPLTALYDQRGHQLAGAILAKQEQQVVVPVMLEGMQLGELRSEVARRFNSPNEAAFSRQQLTASWAIGLVSLLFALLVSVLMARGLLAPVRRMMGSVKALTNGDYSIRMNQQRADELGELMSDIDRLGGALEQSQSLRRRLFADISHELRTPLTILRGELEAMKDGLRRCDSDQLDSLSQEVASLNHLVDDLYDLSVADIGGLKYTFSTVELGACLQASLGMLKARAEDQGIAVRLLELQDLQINADQQRLDQLLHNVFENSLAYTQAPGQIDISLKKQAGWAVLQVSDTPPGVPEEEISRLFDPLYRHEGSRSRRTGGSGLGLAIAWNIVQAHQGRISATRSEAGGICVTIELPLLKESAS